MPDTHPVNGLSHAYEAGDKVFIPSLKRLATVLNVYGDPRNGAQGEMRLDVSGNTIVTDFEPYDALKHAQYDATFEPIKEEWKVGYGITQDIPVRRAPVKVPYTEASARICNLCERNAQSITRKTFGHEDKPFHHIKTCFCGGYTASSFAMGMGGTPEEAEQECVKAWDAQYLSDEQKHWFMAGAWSLHSRLKSVVTAEQYEQISGFIKEAIPTFRVLSQDAGLGRVAMKYVDRAGDIDPTCDPAERICTQFYEAMSAELERHYPHARRSIRPEDFDPDSVPATMPEQGSMSRPWRDTSRPRRPTSR